MLIQLLVSHNVNVSLNYLYLQSLVSVPHALSVLFCMCIIEFLLCFGFLLSMPDIPVLNMPLTVPL